MTGNKEFDDAIHKLENAKYGVEVRDAAVDALRCCYNDIANVNSDEFYKALLKAADEGSVNSLMSSPEPINSDAITEFASKLKKIENSVAELTRQLEESQKKAQSELPISKRLAEAEATTKAINESIFALKNNLEEHKKRVAELKEQTNKIKSLGDNIDVTSKRVGSINASLDKFGNEYTESKESILSRLASLEEKSSAIRSLQNDINEFKSKASSLETISERHDRTIAKLSGSYGTLLEKQGNQASTLSSIMDSINTLFEKINVLSATCDEELLSINEFRSFSTNTTVGLMNIKETQASFEKKLEEVNGANADTYTLAKDTSNAVTIMEMDLSELNSAVADVDQKAALISGLQEQLRDLETIANAVKESISKNAVAISSLEKRTIDLESGNNMAKEYDRLIEDVQNLRAENEQFRNAVNSSLEHILTLIGEKIIGVG